MNASPLLVPNVGAEEGPDWRRHLHVPAVRRTVALWASLFEPRPKAFDWLPGPGHTVAWLNTEEAAREAEAAGRPLAFAAPAVVRRVHDKAFALEVARREELLPACLEDLLVVLEPEELRDAAALPRRLEARIAAWPDWTRGAFTLKPRWGSSGRGRVAGRAGRVDTPELRGALPRLARRGGALLEPWLERCEDLSAQLLLRAGELPLVLGTTRQILTPSGLYLGNQGSVDVRGRIGSACPDDGELREAASVVGRAAAEAGYTGPCGVDAFRFEGPEGSRPLRPVVELNARFTLGTLAIGHVRRALPEAIGPLGLAPDTPGCFQFRLEAPPGGWPAPSSDRVQVPLGEPGDPKGPGILFARSPAALPGPPTET